MTNEKHALKESSYTEPADSDQSLCFEVRAVCPSCKGDNFWMYGRDGYIVYRQCQDCGKRARVRRYRSNEIKIAT